MKRLIFILLSLLFFTENTYAVSREIYGTGVLLMERSTGRVIFEQNKNMLIYPASMIKVLTVLVALEHMNLHEIVVVGDEINYVPFGSSVAGHFIGEHITAENLLYALLLPSGNDTANVVVAHVAYLITGYRMPFPEAEALFTGLMNELAIRVGATSSYFTNAHGFHDTRMRVTALDLATIANYAMDNNIIRQVAGTILREGMSAIGVDGPTREISWHNTNRLLVSEFHFPYATGLKTGFHTPAGHSFIGTAINPENGLEFITVIGGSTTNQRWIDTVYLFEYAFANYSIETIHIGNNVVIEVDVKNPRWGDDETIDLFGTSNFSSLLSVSEIQRIGREIYLFDEPFYVTENYERLLVAPAYAGQILGEVRYVLDGDVIFVDNIVNRNYIHEWSYLASLEYVVNFVVENPISIISLSAYLAIIFFIIIVVSVTSSIIKFRRKRRRRLYR